MNSFTHSLVLALPLLLLGAPSQGIALDIPSQGAGCEGCNDLSSLPADITLETGSGSTYAALYTGMYRTGSEQDCTTHTRPNCAAHCSIEFTVYATSVGNMTLHGNTPVVWEERVGGSSGVWTSVTAPGTLEGYNQSVEVLVKEFNMSCGGSNSLDVRFSAGAFGGTYTLSGTASCASCQ